ncbi:hypothetical protein FITA111629_11525 [Filibacter tadaridae]|uniref:Uncharacterized protein n=1 Tax=Filibacter tadaridae TaxID=2483811 RepID=A0A3P5WH68_9BACL|nr:hypothetical protein [Filibacter tadaridae]VDC21018.1 hypothetical protein FILTAD_00502 [Filibacter tadaridae]
MGKTIYIVLTDTGTLLSKAIGMYTRKDLNHASIAFDEHLNEMYSFGRKQRYNPLVGGFVRENAVEGIFRGADCLIFSCAVTDEQYDKMRHTIRLIEQNKEQYRYNFIGLFGIAFNIRIQRDRAFFCSQFVATIVNEGGVPMFSIKPNFVQPHHFTNVPCLNPVYEGDLRSYLHKVRGNQERKPVGINKLKSFASKLLA